MGMDNAVPRQGWGGRYQDRRERRPLLARGSIPNPAGRLHKTPTKAHFDLGTRQHERSKRLAYQLALEERAQAHKGDDVPVWCPEFPKPTEPDIEDDDWGSL